MKSLFAFLTLVVSAFGLQLLVEEDLSRYGVQPGNVYRVEYFRRISELNASNFERTPLIEIVFRIPLSVTLENSSRYPFDGMGNSPILEEQFDRSVYSKTNFINDLRADKKITSPPEIKKTLTSMISQYSCLVPAEEFRTMKADRDAKIYAEAMRQAEIDKKLRIATIEKNIAMNDTSEPRGLKFLAFGETFSNVAAMADKTIDPRLGQDYLKLDLLLFGKTNNIQVNFVKGKLVSIQAYFLADNITISAGGKNVSSGAQDTKEILAFMRSKYNILSETKERYLTKEYNLMTGRNETVAGIKYQWTTKYAFIGIAATDSGMNVEWRDRSSVEAEKKDYKSF